MDIHTKYEFNQEVWFVDECFDKVPCPACETKGTVILNGKEYSCPNCFNEGFLTNGNDFIYRPFKGNVKEVCARTNGTSYRLAVEHRPFLYATEAELFLTEAEAQAEADRMNEERKQVAK